MTKDKEARSRVNELRSFYRNLLTYLMINVVIVIINLVTNPDQLWFRTCVPGSTTASVFTAASS